MALGNTYNSNDKQPVSVTYSPISFSNPNGNVAQTKLNISYFNKLLKIGIANKKQNNGNNSYDSYDNDNQAAVFISVTKAKIILDLLDDLTCKDDVHNVCIEVKNGLFSISDGTEFGVNSPCIVIRSVDEAGNINTAIYETKSDYHKGAYNYNESDGTYEDVFFNTIEFDLIKILLEQYVKASTYAIAATVMEAGMYKRNAMADVLYNIGRKVGVVEDNNNGGSRNNSSFLSNNARNNSSSNGSNGLDIPKDYETSTFDDIASKMS